MCSPRSPIPPPPRRGGCCVSSVTSATFLVCIFFCIGAGATVITASQFIVHETTPFIIQTYKSRLRPGVPSSPFHVSFKMCRRGISSPHSLLCPHHPHVQWYLADQTTPPLGRSLQMHRCPYGGPTCRGEGGWLSEVPL